MNIKCELVERVSKKTGKKYNCLQLTFPNGYKKTVFLEYAELYMIQAMVNHN